MDASEPSTNGVSANNLFRLSSLLGDSNYDKLARATLGAFEAEIMQYPWLFGSFMLSIVAAATGVKGIVRVGPAVSPALEPAMISLRMPGDQPDAVLPADQVAAASIIKNVEVGPPTIQFSESLFHPVPMDTTLSGGIVEAGETPNPAPKEGTKYKPKETQAPHPKAKARGALETTCFVDANHGLWIKERNGLVDAIEPRGDRKEKVMVCEGTMCRELDEVDGI